jgi:hypothetical protein
MQDNMHYVTRVRRDHGTGVALKGEPWTSFRQSHVSLWECLTKLPSNLIFLLYIVPHACPRPYKRIPSLRRVHTLEVVSTISKQFRTKTKTTPTVAWITQKRIFTLSLRYWQGYKQYHNQVGKTRPMSVSPYLL